MSWQIKGEAGKNLDATTRLLSAVNTVSAELRFESLGADSFSWTQSTDNATGTVLGSSALIPETGQVIEIFKGSARKFMGHVVSVKIGMNSVTCEARGPWWWMERTALSSVVKPYKNESGVDSGVAAERSTFVFPTQGLRTSIGALLDSAAASGVPMTVLGGSHRADMFEVPKIALSNMSYAAALSELMAWIPDAVAYFDYSGASGTLPEINIARRKTGLTNGSMLPLTLTVGTDPIDQISLTPRLDLEVQRVDLNYVTRDATTGRPQWAAQTSGTAGTGQRQIVAVSGPEIVAFLPKDDFDTVRITTVSSVTAALSRKLDSTLAQAVKTYGTAPGSVGSSVTTYSGSLTSGVSSGQATDYVNRDTIYFPEISYQNQNGSYLTSTSGKYLVTSGDLPEWAAKKYNAIKVKVAATWIYTETSSGASSDVFNYYKGKGSSGSGPFDHTNTAFTDYRRWVAVPISFDVWMIDTPFSTATSVYKPWDYDYLTPPAGLASELRQAQNWVPWEGSVSLVVDDVSGDNDLKYKLNVANALPACASMKSLLRSVTHDIYRGRTTYELGAPSRLDFGSLVNKIRRQPSDNIVYL